MAHTDADVLHEHFSVDSLSDSLRFATRITGTYTTLDPAHGPAVEQQLADELTTAAFTFVNTLATDISSGDFELPSWPEIVVRIKRPLENDKCSM